MTPPLSAPPIGAALCDLGLVPAARAATPALSAYIAETYGKPEDPPPPRRVEKLSTPMDSVKSTEAQFPKTGGAQ